MGLVSVRFLGLAAVGVAVLVVLVLVEAHRRDPLLDIGLFRNGRYSLIVGAGTVANCGYCVVVFCTTLYLQEVRGLGPAQAALVFLALAAGAAIAGQLAGRLEHLRPDRVMRRRRPSSAGAAIRSTCETPDRSTRSRAPGLSSASSAPSAYSSSAISR